MIKEARFQHIMERLSFDKKLTLKAISNELKVSEDTVRRDLKELSDQGLLKAVRGGAVPHSPVPYNFNDRLYYANTEKKIIADKALSFIKEGQIILFDSGTSALAIASILPQNLRITAVTNSFPIATILQGNSNVDVLFAGGRLYKDGFATVGHDTIRFLKNISVDVCFMGICSIHPTMGITTNNYEESEVKKVMVDISRQVIALTPFERLNTVEPFHVCPISSLDVIITDDVKKDETEKSFHETGIKIY
jgi:DeoR/GlpR family transcriptional regulator of sugar metabolism